MKTEDRSKFERKLDKFENWLLNLGKKETPKRADIYKKSEFTLKELFHRDE